MDIKGRRSKLEWHERFLEVALRLQDSKRGSTTAVNESGVTERLRVSSLLSAVIPADMS
jgi:hypothetical protein